MRRNPGVVKTGNDGQDHRGPQSDGTQSHDPWRPRELVEQHDCDGGDLGERVGFAEDAGLKFSAPRRGIKDGGHEQNPQIPAKDKHC